MTRGLVAWFAAFGLSFLIHVIKVSHAKSIFHKYIRNNRIQVPKNLEYYIDRLNEFFLRFTLWVLFVPLIKLYINWIWFDGKINPFCISNNVIALITVCLPEVRTFFKLFNICTIITFPTISQYLSRYSRILCIFLRIRKPGVSLRVPRSSPGDLPRNKHTENKSIDDKCNWLYNDFLQRD